VRLSLHRVSKAFSGRTVLSDVDVDFGEAGSVAFIGPSGGGKSTLLRIVAGLEVPDSGGVVMEGHRIDFESEGALRRHRRQLGVVFQAFNLFPHLTALENLTLPLEKVHRLSATDAHSLAMATLDRFRLADHASHRPSALSGGQKQRVAIARAVAVKPRLLLFDEPTSALDPEMTAEVLEVIEEIKAEGRNFLLVTHEMGFARHVADRVAFLARGRIIEYASAEQLFSHPQSSECRDFLSRVLRY
jgi:polar amino acid transport system ATP-binding protein